MVAPGFMKNTVAPSVGQDVAAAPFTVVYCTESEVAVPPVVAVVGAAETEPA